MRRRLVAAFMVVTLASVLGAGLVRTLTISTQLEDRELVHLHEDAEVALEQITRLRADGGKVTAAFLQGLVTDETKLEYVGAGDRRVEAAGSGFAAATAATGAMSAQVFGPEGTVVATQSRQALDTANRRDLPTALTLLVATTMLAGVAGAVLARLLASPFRRLADAAHTLGRGRSDLDLPRSRIQEAEAIATALRGAAGRLERQRRDEHALAERASHVLRTPLTRMLLTLDEMAAHVDLPEDLRAGVRVCQGQAEVIAGEVQGLVESMRAGLHSDASGLPLREIAQEIVARWSERLPARRRVSGAVEGDLELACAPGPLEQVLDLLLEEVVAQGRGPVRLELTGHAEHVLVVLSAGAFGDRDPESLGGVVAARELVSGLGGRLAGHGPNAQLEVRLPCL